MYFFFLVSWGCHIKCQNVLFSATMRILSGSYYIKIWAAWGLIHPFPVCSASAPVVLQSHLMAGTCLQWPFSPNQGQAGTGCSPDLGPTALCWDGWEAVLQSWTWAIVWIFDFPQPTLFALSGGRYYWVTRLWLGEVSVVISKAANSTVLIHFALNLILNYWFSFEDIKTTANVYCVFIICLALF